MPEIKKYTITEPYLEIACGLGEGPYYEPSTNSLRFVDIVNSHLHVVNLSKGPGSLKTYKFPYPVGVTAAIASSPTTPDKDVDHRVILIGGKFGVGLYDKETEKATMLADYWSEEQKAKSEGLPERMRGNDGNVDCMGRFWVGAMNDPAVTQIGTDEGCLFRFDPDLKLHRLIPGPPIPNGGAWTVSNETMYFVDGSNKDIDAYDYDPSTGSISNKRVFYTLKEGAPDGHALDAEDHLWQAVWGGGQVLRINPNGELVAVIEVPTRHVTCVRFVGTDMYITTAADEEGEATERFPHSKKYGGSLFKVDVGVTGREVYKFPYKGGA